MDDSLSSHQLRNTQDFVSTQMGLDALLLHFVSGMHPGDQAETPFQYLTAVPNEDTSPRMLH